MKGCVFSATGAPKLRALCSFHVSAAKALKTQLFEFEYALAPESYIPHITRPVQSYL